VGFLTTLFGTPKIVGAVADTVKSGVSMIDKAFYTDQEKAENAMRFTNTWLKIQQATANENSIRSITRRILAWAIMGTFLALVVSACIIYCFNPAWAIYIKNTIQETQLGWLTVGVGVFYFGTYGIGSYMKKKDAN
jgi:hypothetical protein